MKNVRLILSIFILSILCGCNNTLETQIAKKIKQCDGKECEMNLREITDFEWDTAYFFDIPASQAVINKVIGVDFKTYKEFTRPFIFMKRKKIVYYENNASSIESITKNQVVFHNLADTATFTVVSAKNSIFKGYIEDNGGIDYYRLEQK